MKEGWKKYKIKEIAKLKYGKMPSKNIIRKDGFPIFSGYQVTGYASKFHYDKPKLIVIARGVGGTGKVKIAPAKAWITNLCIIFETDKFIVTDYFLCQLLNLASLKYKLDTGSAQSQITINSLEHFEIKLPPLPTQRKITNILSAYDDLIENNLKRIKLLEEMAQITYEEWFVRMKFPGHETVKFNKKTGLPEGWKKVKLGGVCELTMGQSPKSKFYNFKQIGLPFHQGVKDFGDRFPTNTMWSTKGKRTAEKGSVLFSVRAPVGRMNISLEKIILGRGLASISYKNNYNGFLYYQLKHKFYKDNLIGGGAIFNSVTKNDILQIDLIEGDIKTINKFVTIVKPIDKIIENLHILNQRLKEARDILLPRLMTGMIDVDELEDESMPMAAEPKTKYNS